MFHPEIICCASQMQSTKVGLTLLVNQSSQVIQSKCFYFMYFPRQKGQGFFLLSWGDGFQKIFFAKLEIVAIRSHKPMKQRNASLVSFVTPWARRASNVQVTITSIINLLGNNLKNLQKRLAYWIPPTKIFGHLVGYSCYNMLVNTVVSPLLSLKQHRVVVIANRNILWCRLVIIAYFQSLIPNKLNFLLVIAGTKNKLSILSFLFCSSSSNCKYCSALAAGQTIPNPQHHKWKSTLYCSLLFLFAKADSAMHYSPRDGWGGKKTAQYEQTQRITSATCTALRLFTYRWAVGLMMWCKMDASGWIFETSAEHYAPVPRKRHCHCSMVDGVCENWCRKFV